ncbi:MAG: Fic family protein [Candidatus Nanopelagicales bacterium]|nr:Fic family protein [Actinomycetota bacterium]
MDLDSIQDSPVGQLVPIQGHDARLREFSHFAFLPDPLPETVQLDGTTWTRVAEASQALGRLQQACATLPNPRLLIAPALAREALDTSALEGTHGALADVLEARLSEQRPPSPEVAEIRAYERIAHTAFDWIKERPVTIAMLSDLQGVLAADSRGTQRDPGRVRQHQVVIGPEGSTVYDARYIPPPPDDRLTAGLELWQAWIDAPHPGLPPVVAAAMGHYQFEALHPFGDGNGRLGRLLIVLQLIRLGALTEPALTISPWLLKRRSEYQGHLLAISQTGRWDPWIDFFCQAVSEQAMLSVGIVDRLNIWVAGVRQTLNERGWHGTIASLVDDLIDWPVISASFVQDKYGVSAPTAKSTIDRLCEIGVLHELTGRSYRRVFGATDVMNAVEDL